MASLLNKLRFLPLRSTQNLRIPTYSPSRSSSFKSSPFVCDVGEINVKYETSKNPEEWKYVERLLAPVLVPNPVPKEEYPSGWKPQDEEALKQPYFIPRNKNQMIPVYMKITANGTKRLTYVKKIQGDIWRLEGELREFLQKENKRPIRSQVNELVSYICFHGDHVNAIKYFLSKKNM